jgi:hypothetical protein
MAALEDLGVERPSSHIMVGAYQKWSVLLIKKTPFTSKEREALLNYFHSQDMTPLFPRKTSKIKKNRSNPFVQYTQALKNGTADQFLENYPYDVSVVTDDKPFFYKYYKFHWQNPFKLEYDRHSGTMIFITQIAVLVQALIFIALFIFVPLVKFRMSDIQNIPSYLVMPFITYFSCLGVGFMAIEIPLMQKFVLLLGSPIYSISVTLTALLIFSGLGSLLSSKLQDKLNLFHLTGVLIIVIGAQVAINHLWLNQISVLAFWLRAVIVGLLLLPVGLCLGMYFPTGLRLFGKSYPSTIAWAWGLNCAFSVLGSILSIILAQYFGFNFILVLALGIYVAGSIALELAKKRIN